MNVVLTTKNGRIAPCFTGVELWIIGPGQSAGECRVIYTAGRDPVLWARDLVRADVSTLLCTGIDMFVSGSIRGNGIQVITEAIGTVDEVLNRWRAGELKTQPIYPQRDRRYRGPQVGRNTRFRGGSKTQFRRQRNEDSSDITG